MDEPPPDQRKRAVNTPLRKQAAMARNDQMIRQWHLMRQLEGPRGKTIHEPTQALPQNYIRHERTIRRDLEALEASGVPLITKIINGHIRWRCMDGYRKTVA